MRYGGGTCPACGGPVRVVSRPQPVEDGTDGTLWVRYEGRCLRCGASLVDSARVRPRTGRWQFAPPDRKAG